MRLSSPKPMLALAAVLAACSLTWAQVERLNLAQMVSKTDNAVDGTIVERRVFRVDDPVDGPELYFTTLKIQGKSLADDASVTIDVTFAGGFVSPTEGAYNSEAPSADEVRVGNRVVAFYKYVDNMGGRVSANALYASHGGLYRVADLKGGPVVLGRGDGYAIQSNQRVADLRLSVRALAKQPKQK